MFSTFTQRGRKSAAILVSGVAIAGLLAACSSSGNGGAATNDTNTNTTSPAAGATSPAEATSPADTAAGTAGASAGLAAAQAQVTGWSQELTAASMPAITPLSKKVDLKGKTVYLVPLSDGIPVIHAQLTGAEQGLQAAGAKTKVCDGGAGGQPNPTSWGNCLKQALDAKADAVMSLLIDYAAVPTAFDALVKAGIPTLLGGVQGKGLTPQTGKIGVFDNSGQKIDDGGRLGISAYALGGDGTNLLNLHLLDSDGTAAASANTGTAFQKACPSCGLDTVDFTTANSQAQLAAAVSAALVKNPKINMVSVPVDSFSPLAIQGIQQAGKTGSVKVVSGSGSLDAFQRIQGGTQVATTVSPSLLNGWNYANGMMQLLAGDPISKPDTSLNRVITKDNVGTLALTTAASKTDEWVFGDSTYSDAFLTAWGLK